MFAIVIDRSDQLRKRHAALAGDLLQALPELVFKADARLVACNNNRALENRRPHDFSFAHSCPHAYFHRHLPAASTWVPARLGIDGALSMRHLWLWTFLLSISLLPLRMAAAMISMIG